MNCFGYTVNINNPMQCKKLFCGKPPGHLQFAPPLPINKKAAF
jgi:hypothetical protein